MILCRVKDDPGFTYTGVNYAGPLYVRVEYTSKSTKIWISLYTRLVTREVHLDIVSDASTETFIICLKRFAARSCY